jgi:phosphatidylinositol glycan class S
MTPFHPTTLERTIPLASVLTFSLTDYLQDVIQTFKRVHEIGVESQVVHYAQLKRSPFYDQTTHEYYFTPATLPRFVEGTEWKVDSGSSAKENTLHFAVFVPSPSHSPLVIRNGGHTISTGFTTPQWGGVVILNLPNEQRPTNFEIDRSSFVAPLQVFVSQMRQLMGIPTFSANIASPSKTFENIIVLPAVKKGASDWEIDALSRRHIWNMLKETQHTLTQFTRMMDQIPNIPIYDHIHDTLQHALTKRSTTLEILAKPSQHDIAHSAISDALTASEDVFFDKDMVGMLYFPSGHQLAIYVPLFLPLCFPIITGLRNEWSLRKQKRATK